MVVLISTWIFNPLWNYCYELFREWLSFVRVRYLHVLCYATAVIDEIGEEEFGEAGPDVLENVAETDLMEEELDEGLL